LHISFHAWSSLQYIIENFIYAVIRVMYFAMYFVITRPRPPHI